MIRTSSFCFWQNRNSFRDRLVTWAKEFIYAINPSLQLPPNQDPFTKEPLNNPDGLLALPQKAIRVIKRLPKNITISTSSASFGIQEDLYKHWQEAHAEDVIGMDAHVSSGVTQGLVLSCTTLSCAEWLDPLAGIHAVVCRRFMPVLLVMIFLLKTHTTETK